MRARGVSPADRRFAAAVGVLALVRVAVPLAALAAGDVALPGQREALSAAASPAGLLAVLVLGGGGGAALLLRRGAAPAWLQLLAAVGGVAAAATVVVAAMSPPGAPVVGWPLVWSVALAPARLAGEPSEELAWGLGLALSLACVAAVVAGCAELGRRATGSRGVGLAAAALYTAFPFVTGALVGEEAWENGSWLVDTGLALYTEPLSTALVTWALVLLVGRRPDAVAVAAAGALLGFATAVKISNGLIAAALVPLVALRDGLRAAVPLAVGGLVFAPLVAVYWDKGYEALYGGPSTSDDPWGLEYAERAWTESTLFTPALLLLLLPFLVVGCLALAGDRFVLALLLAPVVVTAAFYSVYDLTAIHPRFLFVALPPLFVLEAAGGAAVLRALGPRLRPS